MSLQARVVAGLMKMNNILFLILAIVTEYFFPILGEH